MKYQVMRDLTKEEFSLLKESIIEKGILVPILIDEFGNIIDGHHRKKICDELGITDYPTQVYAGLTDEEKIKMAQQLNEARRQLTKEEKKLEIKRILQEAPQLSNVRIAKKVGVSDKTIGEHRKKLESASEIPSLKKTLGADGKEYPRPEKPTTKVCRKCEQEKPIEDFYTGKPDCKSCYNANKIKGYHDIKGNIIHSNPEVDKLFRERGDILNSITNLDRVVEYTIDDLGEELQSVVEYFKRNAHSRLADHSELLHNTESKQKITTVLSEAETAIEKMRREFLL